MSQNSFMGDEWLGNEVFMKKVEKTRNLLCKATKKGDGV
jgi:hypothetical protein